MPNYKFEIEKFEGNGGEARNSPSCTKPDFAKEGICAWMYRGDGKCNYREGQKFSYPDEIGKICPWAQDSINMIVRTLACDGKLSWKYEGTPYQKKIEENGITTEFIRCIDPTKSGIVFKVTRIEK